MGTILNSGAISSSAKNGVANDGGQIGTIINSASGATNGSIGIANAYSTGLSTYGSIGVITNNGRINGARTGLYRQHL